MKYTKIPATAFQNIQMNAGILLKDFNPATATIDGILGATSGGVTFNASPTFSDYGEDIDNCPKNTLELKKLDSWEAKMSGTFISVTAALAKDLVAAAEIDSDDATHIIPRNDILATDFTDLWWVGDYSDINEDGTDGEQAGFCAIHVMNALSTGGFQIKSTDKGKGQFSFEYTGHYKMSEQDKVPFEIFVKMGEA